MRMFTTSVSSVRSLTRPQGKAPSGGLNGDHDYISLGLWEIIQEPFKVNGKNHGFLKISSSTNGTTMVSGEDVLLNQWEHMGTP